MDNNITKYLNDEQKRFYDLIVTYPRIASFWDWEKREVNIEQITTAIPAMSHGEQLLANFFVSLWLGKSTWGADVIEVAAELDNKERMMIANWLVAPFWP